MQKIQRYCPYGPVFCLECLQLLYILQLLYPLENESILMTYSVEVQVFLVCQSFAALFYTPHYATVLQTLHILQLRLRLKAISMNCSE